MKKNKKFIVTLSMALVLVIISSTLLGYGFGNIQKKKQEYTAVTEETDISTITPKEAESTSTKNVDKNLDYITPKTKETFKVENVTFAIVEGSSEPVEKDLPAKEMAELLIKEHSRLFPEKKLDATIYMNYLDSKWYFTEDYSSEYRFLIKNSDNIGVSSYQQASIASLYALANSVTGEFKEFMHPNLTISTSEKWISNDYFCELVGDKLQSRGRDLIREYDLVGSGAVINNLTTGFNLCQYGVIAVSCEFDKEKMVAVYMDMKTQEFVGYIKNDFLKKSY